MNTQRLSSHEVLHSFKQLMCEGIILRMRIMLWLSTMHATAMRIVHKSMCSVDCFSLLLIAVFVGSVWIQPLTHNLTFEYITSDVCTVCTAAKTGRGEVGRCVCTEVRSYQCVVGVPYLPQLTTAYPVLHYPREYRAVAEESSVGSATRSRLL